MRSSLALALVLGLLLLGSGGAGAADSDVSAILDKAIKAHGGAEKLGQERAVRVKSKGTVAIGDGADFTAETTTQAGKFRQVIQLSVAGQEVTMTVVFDGMKGWQNANGATKEIEGDLLDDIKEGAYANRLRRMAFLKDKSLQLSPLGETKVNDRPAVGIKVVSKGHPDVKLFFDKESGLLVKTERQVLDGMTQQKVLEEWIVQAHQEADGMKLPKKVLINHDGKKFIEQEVTEITFPKQLAKDEFAEP
jgi:hypothetical protein